MHIWFLKTLQATLWSFIHRYAGRRCATNSKIEANNFNNLFLNPASLIRYSICGVLGVHQSTVVPVGKDHWPLHYLPFLCYICAALISERLCSSKSSYPQLTASISYQQRAVNRISQHAWYFLLLKWNIPSIMQSPRNKASGLNHIPPYILENCAKEISSVLKVIFTESFTTGNLPSDWLTANVCPIYKKGRRDDASNYRPIFLTSICCKVLEHIICHNIINHLNSNNILIQFPSKPFLCHSTANFNRKHYHMHWIIRNKLTLCFSTLLRHLTQFHISDFSLSYTIMEFEIILITRSRHGLLTEHNKWSLMVLNLALSQYHLVFLRGQYLDHSCSCCTSTTL